MERRHFLKLALGYVAGAAALAASAKAAPLPPISAEHGLAPPHGQGAEPAVTTQDDVDRLKPEEVRWGHGRGHHRGWHRGHHWGWRRRHWGWRRRRHYGWRRRHWGWHRRRWHRRRRYWRRRYW